MKRFIYTSMGSFAIRSVMVCIVTLALPGCKKVLDIGPSSTSINVDNVFSTESTAIASATGLYAGLVNSLSALSPICGVSSDELTYYGGASNATYIAYYRNTLTQSATVQTGGSLWTNFYNFIYNCNLAIGGLNKSPIRQAAKNQLLGEVKMVRAYCYFYLVNLFGDAVLVTTTDPAYNMSLPRVSKDKIYVQIIQDLKDAQQLLSPGYLDATLIPYTTGEQRLRPNASAATALLARVYLYSNDYVNAEIESSKVIDNKALYDTLPLNQVFLKNSKEAIWQWQPIYSNWNADDGLSFILPSTGPGASNAFYLTNAQLAAFEPGDKRAMNGNWINSVTAGGVTYYYPFKYKLTSGPVNEYNMVLRLGEQYLIRAEARAQQSKLTGAGSAAADLNLIRARAGLAATTATTKEDMLKAVMQERRVEMFTEVGHRWMDIKRTGNVDAVMNAAALVKGTTWQSFRQLFPLPFNDILRAGGVLVQNQGY